jgi:hypothetical protein
VEVVAGEVIPGVDWPLRLSDVQPATVAGGELPFGGLEVSTVAGIAMALLGLGGFLVASARWVELRPAPDAIQL